MSKGKNNKKTKGDPTVDYEDIMKSLQEQNSSSSNDDDDESLDTSDPEFTQQLLKKLSPEVRNRIYALRSIQDEFVSNTYEQYIDEMGQLEKKYEALYAPLYARRASIINGEASPTEKEVQDGLPEDTAAAEVARLKIEEEASKPDKTTSTKSGIPDFWLHALQHDYEVGKLITVRDEPALRGLTDIRYVLHDDPKTGFTLMFFFNQQNEYFENTCLSKRVDVKHEDQIVQVTQTVGTEILWKPHKNLTVVERTKKQRSNKTKDVRFVTVTTPSPSFFRFFLSNTAPMNPFDVEDDAEDVNEEDHFKYTTEEDHELALIIKDRIIPRAVEFFTGEADSENDDEDFEDEDEEEDEDEDEDEDGDGGNAERESYRPSGSSKGNNRGGAKKGPSSKQSDCKQQ